MMVPNFLYSNSYHFSFLFLFIIIIILIFLLPMAIVSRLFLYTNNQEPSHSIILVFFIKFLLLILIFSMNLLKTGWLPVTDGPSSLVTPSSSPTPRDGEYARVTLATATTSVSYISRTYRTYLCYTVHNLNSCYRILFPIPWLQILYLNFSFHGAFRRYSFQLILKNTNVRRLAPYANLCLFLQRYLFNYLSIALPRQQPGCYL